jgi:hypothetical protein
MKLNQEQIEFFHTEGNWSSTRFIPMPISSRWWTTLTGKSPVGRKSSWIKES